MNTTEPTVLVRNWGTERIVVRTPTHAGKVLERKAGTKGGFQFHVKEESHYLYRGSLKLEYVDGDKVWPKTIEAGEAWTVPPFTLHRETALTDCVLFEVSDPTQDDRFGIVPDPGGLPSMTDADAAEKLVRLAQALEVRAKECRQLAQNVQTFGLKAWVPPAIAVTP